MSKELWKSPKTQSEIAKELWELAKQEDGWPDEMRMAYIMGACDGLRKMQEMLHPFELKE